MLRSGRRLGRPVRPAASLRRQELRAVDAAAVGDRAVHLGQPTGGGHAVRRRDLAVEQRNIALHNGLASRESTSRRTPPENWQRGELRRDKVEHRVGSTCSAAPMIWAALRGRIRRRPAQVQPVGVRAVRRAPSRISSRIPMPVTDAGQARHQPAVRQRVVRRLADSSRLAGAAASRSSISRWSIRSVLLAPLSWDRPARCRMSVADGDRRLAVGAELRPVLGDGRVVVDQAAVGQPVDDGRGHALGRREHHGAGVGRPARRAATVGPAGPDVDDGLAVQVDRQRAAAEPAVRETVWAKARTAQAKFGSAAPWTPCGSAALRSRSLTLRHNVLNLPATPANNPSVTDSLSHCPSAASRICCAASAGVSSPSRT